jgi:hypothetical protein
MGVAPSLEMTAIEQLSFEGGEEVLAQGSSKRLAAVPIQHRQACRGSIGQALGRALFDKNPSAFNT